MNTQEEEFLKLNSLIDCINQISDGKILGNTQKQTLFCTYFDLANEHIQAIYFLIKQDFFGSALALVRPYYETFYRALWMYAFATDTELEEIRNGKFEFKNMGSKIKELDTFYTGDDYFKKLKKGTWNIMSDYNHSGSCQLSRRWTGDVLEPNYSEDELLEVFRETRNTLQLFAYILFRIHNFDEDELVSIQYGNCS